MSIFFLIKISNINNFENPEKHNMKLQIIGLKDCTFSIQTKNKLPIGFFIRLVNKFTEFENNTDVEYIEINQIQELKDIYKKKYEISSFPIVLFNNKLIGGNDTFQEIISNIDNTNEVINNYQNKYNLKLKKLEPIEIKRLKEILNNYLFNKK